MNDLTILYYTDNTIPEKVGQRVRDYLLGVTKNQYPIISVSQKPIDFGQNICIGQIGKSKYNLFKQVLIGVRGVKTRYVACAEDDTLYAPDHFLHRPPEGVFAYENNYWLAEERQFYWRPDDVSKRMGMWGCIATTKALLKNLTIRYTLFPTDPLPLRNKYLFWEQPGTHDQLYGMKNRLEHFGSKNPTVVFVHRGSLGGFKNRHGLPKPENITYNLNSFGGIKKLWNNYWS